MKIQNKQMKINTNKQMKISTTMHHHQVRTLAILDVAPSVHREPSKKLRVSSSYYANVDSQKSDILADNKGKSGIYKWTRRRSGDSYVGSSVDIKGRLKAYFNLSYLEHNAKLGSLICKALVKYGYSAFSFEILSYCSPSDLKKTEQKYMDLLKPKYNTLKVAGNSGLKRTPDESSKQLMREAKLGKPRSDETKAKMSANRAASKALRVTNVKTGDVMDLSSIRRAAAKLGVSHVSLSTHLKNKGFYESKGYSVYPLA